MRPVPLLPLLAALAGPLAVGHAPPAAAQARVPAAPAALPSPGPEALARLAGRLRRLDEDGLDPRAYAIPPDDAPAPALLRAAAGALADLLQGRVRELPGRPDLRRSPPAIGPWLAELAASPEPAAVIERAALLPADAAALRAELARARALAILGGLPAIPPGEGTLEPDAADPVRVPALRARLAAEDAVLAAAADEGEVLGPELAAAVRRFQAREGLEPDGRVGRGTLAALNRPPEARVRRLRVALDQRRGVAPPGPGRRIEVNVPDHTLTVLDGSREVLAMAVVVGRPNRATPLMQTRLTAVMFNPPWGVPERNAREDLLPRFRRDPRAMLEKGFRVYSYVGGERVEVDALAIDWRGVDPQRFPYVIRQDAGESNALGRLKFIIPNGEDIYMHDTPDRGLFRRADRAHSSGCIRLERPMEMLDVALAGTAGWDRARAAAQLESRATATVGLGRALPVRLHYTATVVGRDGAVRVRPDVYGLDAAYARALDAPRPAPLPAVAPFRPPLLEVSQRPEPR